MATKAKRAKATQTHEEWFMEGQRDKLRGVIRASGKSHRYFAHLIGVDERTVRRWLEGTRPITGPVQALTQVLFLYPQAFASLDDTTSGVNVRRRKDGLPVE